MFVKRWWRSQRAGPVWEAHAAGFATYLPVQSVVNNPAQLSGRGFPRIVHMKLVLSQLYVFWYSKIDAEPCNSQIRKFEI